MSIKELVLQMKCRPYAFVAKKEIAFVSCFISGFLYSNIMSGRISAEEIAFKSFFSNWVKKELEKQRQLEYEVNRNCVLYQ